MRTAVLSDIHGNLEAFREVLADLDTRNVDRIISLGDIINYGPDSEEIVKEHIRLNICGIQGNHENALINIRMLNRLNSVAHESLRITQKLLSNASMEYIRTLPLYLTMDQMRFVHGTPPESVKEYIIQIPLHILGYIFESYPEMICFVGHTHLLGLYEYYQNKVKFIPLSEKHYDLKSGRRYIINAGSVGQPRTRDKRSAYVIYDDSLNILNIHHIDYDARKTAQKIRELGYPEFNAQRLL